PRAPWAVGGRGVLLHARARARPRAAAGHRPWRSTAGAGSEGVEGRAHLGWARGAARRRSFARRAAAGRPRGAARRPAHGRGAESGKWLLARQPALARGARADRARARGAGAATGGVAARGRAAGGRAFALGRAGTRARGD